MTLKCECGGELDYQLLGCDSYYLCPNCGKELTAKDLMERCSTAEAKLAEVSDEAAGFLKSYNEAKTKLAEAEKRMSSMASDYEETMLELTALRSRVEGVTEEKIVKIFRDKIILE